MSQIRIERVPINNLQVIGFDHLQLTFEPTVPNPQWPQDDWFVIEGVFEQGPDGPILGVTGGDGSTTLPEANGGLIQQDLVTQIGTPDSRGSHILATGPDPFSDWQVMAAYGSDIDSQRLPYNAQLLASRTLANINSSSVVATLLSVIGIDIANNLAIAYQRHQALMRMSSEVLGVQFMPDGESGSGRSNRNIPTRNREPAAKFCNRSPICGRTRFLWEFRLRRSK